MGTTQLQLKRDRNIDTLHKFTYLRDRKLDYVPSDLVLHGDACVLSSDEFKVFGDLYEGSVDIDQTTAPESLCQYDIEVTQCHKFWFFIKLVDAITL